MAEEKKYNGWNNYETWNAALWIDNDQGSYSQRCEMAQSAYDDAEGDTHDEKLENARRPLADALEAWIDDQRPDLGASMFADLLGAALGEIDWYEIAENFLTDVDPVEAPEEGSGAAL